jgi:ATP-dependent protease ClpP protease subunit
MKNSLTKQLTLAELTDGLVDSRATTADVVLGMPNIISARTVRYIGPITRATNERLLKQIEKLVNDAPDEEIFLFITSTGGPTGTAISFFDTIRHVLKPRLTTIGSGDVDSSAVIIFLSGSRRFVTKRTTLLLHPAGRFFGNQRYTAREMEAMLAEDRYKDDQYATILADHSQGSLHKEDVLAMMETQTVLSPARLVELGFALAIIS